MSLTSGPVTSLQTEYTTFKLFAEFLGGYFDGGKHVVGINDPCVFPKATMLFQQADPQQNPVLIHVVWIRPGTMKRYRDTINGQPKIMLRGRCSWLFFVKVKAAMNGDGSSKDLVMPVSGLLSGLLNNSAACLPLAEKGIGHLRALPPTLISDGSQYQIRQVQCSGEIRYPM